MIDEELTSNLLFPDDLVLSCLARVSRLDYPILSLVSKSLRSLLASPELHKTRSLLNRTEISFYVCLQYPPDPKPRWFTLCRKPNKTLTSKKKEESSSGYVLAQISFINTPPMEWSNLVAVDHNIYAICAAPCSNLSFLDCRTNTWHEVPSLRLAHTSIYLNGSIYLPGSSENPESLNCVEVFDTNSQTWKPVPPEKRKFVPGDMEGKIHMNHDPSGGYGMTINPKEMKTEGTGLGTNSICMIGNISYTYFPNEQIRWSRSGLDGSRKVEGLEGLTRFVDYLSVRLVDFGGKMVVLWDKYLPPRINKEKMIMCAVISLEKRGNEEIWGKVEWFDAVLAVPMSYKFVYAIAATV